MRAHINQLRTAKDISMTNLRHTRAAFLDLHSYLYANVPPHRPTKVDYDLTSFV